MSKQKRWKTKADNKIRLVMKKRPANLPKKYGWCPKPNHGVILRWISEKCFKCKEETQRRKEGKCCAILGHGPGHQSKTYCQVIGKHKTHECIYGNYDQVATWRGPVNKIKFTSYFDEPPNYP